MDQLYNLEKIFADFIIDASKEELKEFIEEETSLDFLSFLLKIYGNEERYEECKIIFDEINIRKGITISFI